MDGVDWFGEWGGEEAQQLPWLDGGMGGGCMVLFMGVLYSNFFHEAFTEGPLHL